MDLSFPHRRSLVSLGSTRRPRPALRAIFGAAVVASILTLALGCDKRASDAPKEASQTSLAGKPRTLLFVFGDRADPRVLPLATLVDGKIKPLQLDASGWRGFDQLYFPAGAHLSVYHDGKPMGEAVVRRGMWEGTNALYKLPSCQALRPLAAVTVANAPADAVMLELIATSDPLAGAPQRGGVTAADLDSARAFISRVGQREGLTNAARAELDQVVTAIHTGVTTRPSLVGTYIDRASGTGSPRHVFALGDYNDSTKAYVQSFVHVPGESREFRRYIDHVDLTGDGQDEIVVEGTGLSGDSYLVFLQYRINRWREIARGATSWCVDPKA